MTTNKSESTIMTDQQYMRRALQLASNGAGYVSPNPQVGAVVVAPDGGIIGEGWHRRYGGPHAEVNAIASVSEADRQLLSQSTIYVTLEPCSHYGKTPPCSKLLIDNNIRRVVVGITDPFKEVSGRGIRMLRKAGIEVTTGVLEKECAFINRRFILAHTLRRPYIQLKWAQSADGFMAAADGPTMISNPVSLAEMHAQRAIADAILVGTNTILTDNPTLTNRLWSGHSPRPVIFKSNRLPADCTLLDPADERHPIILDPSMPLVENMESLYRDHSITSLMVEGGAALLSSFIKKGLYDEIRIETSPALIGAGVKAPALPAQLTLHQSRKIRKNLIDTYFNPEMKAIIS